MKQTAAIVAFLIVGIGLMIGASKLSQRYLLPMLSNSNRAAPTATPTPDSTRSPTNGYRNLNKHPLTQAEFDSLVNAAERSQAPNARHKTPEKNAYKWKDSRGQWVISDNPPPEGIQAEIIEISATLR